MHFSSLLLVAFVAPAAFVGAQSDTATSPAPTSTGAISPCVLQCVEQASSSAGCSGVADLTCLCTSTDFQTSATSCLQSNCSSDDLAAGQALQQQQCATVSGATSLTGTGSLSSEGASASSEAGSLTSAASSLISSISSAASSGASSLASRASSASSAASSAASEASSGSATSSKVIFSTGVFVSGIVGILGIAAGALLV